MRRRGLLLEVIFLGGLCAAAAALLWYGSSIPLWQDDTLGPGAYPLLALSGVFLCGGWLLLRALMNRDLRLISPFPEGLADDTRLRVLVGGLSRSLGQRVAVDRRVGEGAFSAFHAGIRLARDGSVATIVASDGTSLPNFDAAAFCEGRFRPAAGLFFDPDVAIVRVDSAWTSIDDALAERGAGDLRIAFNHHRDLRHGLDEWLAHGLGARFTPSYDPDSQQLLAALAEGAIDVAVMHFSEARNALSDGRARCIAVAAPRPPEASGPALLDRNGAPVVSGRWAALMMPADTPEPLRQRWEQAALAAIATLDQGGSHRGGAAWEPIPGHAMTALLAVQIDARRTLPDRTPVELRGGRRGALVAAIAGLAIFPFIMPQLGFSITAFLYSAGMMAMLWPRLTPVRIAVTLAAAVVLAFGSEALFGGVFGVVFPAARLFGG